MLWDGLRDDSAGVEGGHSTDEMTCEVDYTGQETLIPRVAT